MQAPFTAYHDSPNKSVRQNVPRRGVVLHHGALTSLDYLRRLTMGEKQVSSSAICKDINFEQMMTDGWRPWSLSSAFWDSALRSVETANESTAGWTISESSQRKLAEGVAYWATIDGFWPHRDGAPSTWTVIGHREVYTIHGASYATACPGGMDLNLVVRFAQEILRAGGVVSAPAGVDREDDMYDAAAQQALFEKIETEARPAKLYQQGTGIIALGQGGGFWIVPSNDYVVLGDYLGLWNATAITVNDAQWNLLRTLSNILNPDPQVTKAIDAVVSLKPEDVAELAKQIGERKVVLTEEQAAALTAAARDGAVEAVKALSFVTVAQ